MNKEKDLDGKMCKWIQLPILEYQLKSELDDEEKVEEILKWCELSSYSSKEVIDNVIEKIELGAYLEGMKERRD